MNRFNASHYQIPAPRYSGSFEDLCLDLFRKIWNDPLAKKNGRNGQGQHGVDIYSSNLPGQGLSGIQCKNKDLQLNKGLKVQDIDAEIKAANDFKPRLSSFIIITVDPKDTALEEHVRLICEEHIKDGLFRVDIMFWDDVVPHLGDHPEVADKHLGTGWDQAKTVPSEDNTIQTTDSDAMAASSKDGVRALIGNSNQQVQISQSNVSIIYESESKITDEYHQEVNVGKELIEKNQYTAAFEYLLELKKRIWHSATDPVKFRLLTNIASAQYHLLQTKEAANNFLEAFKLQPDDTKAKSNKVFAFLLLEEYNDALQEAEAYLKTDPDKDSVIALKIQAMAHLGTPFTDIVKSVDKKMQKSVDVSYALSFAANLLGDKEESLNWIEVAAKSDDNPSILANLGMSLLDKVINDNPTAIKGSFTPEETQKAERAIQLLGDAWSKLPDPRDRQFSSEWLFNRITGHRLLRQDHESERLSSELLQLQPDNEMYVKNAAVIAFESGRAVEAEGYLRKLIDQGSKLPELPIMLADALRAQKNDGEALKVTEDFVKTYKGRDDLWGDANENLFDLYFNKQDFESAQMLADNLSQHPGTLFHGLLFSARLCIARRENDKANSFLEQAEKNITDEIRPKSLIDLAELAHSAKAYDIAARMYRKTINPNTDTPFTRRYLHSLYETGQYQDVINIAQKLREAEGAKDEIAQFEWASYLELKDLPNGKKVLEAYIKDNPEDESAKLRVAIIDTRSGNKKAVEAYLKSDIVLYKLDLFSSIQLANLYQLHKQPQRTLEIIYDVRRRFPNEADAHSAYISIFFGLENSQSKKLRPKEVSTDTTLIYEGGHFTIEDDNPQNGDYEISTEDATERGFIGKKKGDDIILSTNHLGIENETKINEVKSKYIFALHDSMQNYERRFLDRNDIAGFKVDGSNFDPLFKQLDQTHDHAEQIEKLYKEGKLTVDLFAKLVGKDLIEVIYALRQTPSLGIRVANGTAEELDRANEDLAGNQIIVADITALVTLHGLGLKPSDIGLGKLVIAQTTKDIVTGKIAKHDSIEKKSSMTLYKHKGKYIRHEVSAKEQRQRLKSLKELLKWVDANTVVEPLTQLQFDKVKNNTNTPEKLDEIIDSAQLDAISLAIGDDRILYCDDAGLRSLVTTTFGLKGVWTQALLANQLDKKKLSKEDYELASIQLAMANYHHTGINPDILLRAAKESNWLPKDAFTQVLKTLSRPEVNPQSMAVVLVNFLYEFYKHPIATERAYIVQQVLTEATRHHDKHEVLMMLEAGINVRFKLLPVQSGELKQTITNWRQPYY